VGGALTSTPQMFKFWSPCFGRRGGGTFIGWGGLCLVLVRPPTQKKESLALLQWYARLQMHYSWSQRSNSFLANLWASEQLFDDTVLIGCHTSHELLGMTQQSILCKRSHCISMFLSDLRYLNIIGKKRTIIFCRQSIFVAMFQMSC